MMLSKRITCILVAIFCTRALAQTDQFDGPLNENSDTGTPIWPYGSSQTIGWTPIWPTVTLYLWQDYPFPNGSANYDILVDVEDDIVGLMYTVNTTIDLRVGNIFYLRLYNGSYDGPYPNAGDISHIESHRFEIQASGSIVNSTTSQPHAATATSQPSGLTSVDKIGLGVGLGIGLPVLACLCAAVVLLLAKRGQRTVVVPQREHAGLPQYVEQEQATNRKHGLGRADSYRLSELGDSTRRLQTPELEGRTAS